MDQFCKQFGRAWNLLSTNLKIPPLFCAVIVSSCFLLPIHFQSVLCVAMSPPRAGDLKRKSMLATRSSLQMIAACGDALWQAFSLLPSK